MSLHLPRNFRTGCYYATKQDKKKTCRYATQHAAETVGHGKHTAHKPLRGNDEAALLFLNNRYEGGEPKKDA